MKNLKKDFRPMPRIGSVRSLPIRMLAEITDLSRAKHRVLSRLIVYESYCRPHKWFWPRRLLSIFSLLAAVTCTAAMCQIQGPELAEQSGHDASVEAIVITPDLHWLISGGNDFSVRLWDLRSGREVRILGRHTREVHALAACPDSSCVVSGGNDQVLKLWELPTGRLLRTFIGHTAGIQGVVFTKDGKRLISSAGDPPNFENRKPDFSVRIWDVQTGKELEKFTGHQKILTGVDLSADGNLLATGSYDGTIRIWDLRTKKHVRVISGFTGGVRAKFMQGGRTLASANGQIKLWEVSSGNMIHGFLGRSWPDHIAAGPDGKLIAFANNRNVGVVDADTGAQIANLVPQGSRGDVVQSVAFSPDGHWLFSGFSDGSIVQWDLITKKAWRDLSGHTSRVDAIALSSNGRWLASGHRDSTIRIWDTVTGALEETLKSGNREIITLAFSRDNRWLAASGNDYGPNSNTSIEIWDISGREKAFSFIHPAKRVEFLIFSPDGRWLASAGVDASVKIWDVARRALVQTLSPANKAIAFAPDGKWVATGSRDNTLTYWELPSGRNLQRFPNIGWAYAISSDGNSLASTGWLNDFKVWDLKSVVDWSKRYPDQANQSGEITIVLDPFHHRRQHTFRGHTDFVSDLAFSPNGKQVASCSWDGQIKIWDLKSGREIRTLAGHSSGVTSVRFSEDGRWLVSGGWDGSVRIWNAQTGYGVISLLAMRGSDDWLAVAPDGLFDGTSEAMQQVAWRTEADQVLPLENYFADFYHPGLLSDIVAGREPRAQVDIATVLQVPSLRIMLSQKQAHIEVRSNRAVACFEQKPGVAVQAPVGGGPDLPTEMGSYRVQPGDPTCKYQKELPSSLPGSELAGKLERWKPELFTTPWDGQASPTSNSTLHVLTVGIGHYSQGSGFEQIAYAGISAKTIEDFFKQKSKNGGSYAHVRVWPGLYDAAATKNSVRERLNEMASAVKVDDVVLLYFAGHGMVPAEQEMFYFATFEGLEESIQTTGLSTAMLAESIRKIPARRIALFIDACESGGAVEALSKIGEAKVRAEQQREYGVGPESQTGRGAGVYVIAATMPKAYAIPLGADQSALAGVFLQTLKRGNRAFSIRQIIADLEKSLPEASQKASGFRQVPLITSLGLDFPLM